MVRGGEGGARGEELVCVCGGGATCEGICEGEG